MRAFVAIELPSELVDSLARFQGRLESTGADLKLVERANLHFTVKFLGEIGEAEGAEAASRLRGLPLRRMAVEIKGAGAFPSLTRPRVVWAGVSREQQGAMGEIAQAVVGALDGIGERDDRPFQAHVTLARVRSQRASENMASLLRESAGMSFGGAELTELKLKASTLTPRGPVYTDVGVFPLR